MKALMIYITFLLRRLCLCFCVLNTCPIDYLYAPSRMAIPWRNSSPPKLSRTDSHPSTPTLPLATSGLRPNKASCPQEGLCPFCKELAANNNEQYLILSRSNGIVVQLNPKPYTIGSILIYPEKHVSNPDELSPITWCDMFLTARQVMDLLDEYFDLIDDTAQPPVAPSFSIGMNIGPHANGSIPGHLHLHVVPRLPQENNGFLETCCNTRLVQHSLVDVYNELKEMIE